MLVTSTQIETWALRVLEAVRKGYRVEDSRIELKREFPADPAKAARRIAAHANSARGAPILWLIGVDEKLREIVGSDGLDLANWYSGVRSAFDGVVPSFHDLNIHIEDKSILALQFDTDRAPYLVKNPSGGAIQREVPWREGTRIDTATREQLLMLLRPEVPIPEVEVMDAVLEPFFDEGEFFILLHVYLVPTTTDRIVIPFHRCSAKIISNGQVLAHSLRLSCSHRESGAAHWFHRETENAITVDGNFRPVEIEPDQAIIHRPAFLKFLVQGKLTGVTLYDISEPTVEISLSVVGAQGKLCSISVPLPHKEPSLQKGSNAPTWRMAALQG